MGQDSSKGPANGLKIIDFSGSGSFAITFSFIFNNLSQFPNNKNK